MPGSKDARVKGIQLTGRHAWSDEQTNAARAYAREPNSQKLEELRTAQRRAAEEFGQLQARLGFAYATDGGFRLKDDFTPYVEKVAGVGGGQGQINRQPGTRNAYYFTPIVSSKLQSDAVILDEYLYPAAIPAPLKKKLILASPLSFVLAAEGTGYSNQVELLYDFSDVQSRAIRAHASEYQYVQLNESFSTDERFARGVTKDLLSAFRDCLDKTFADLPVRSAVYFSSGNAKDILPVVLGTKVTDIGFDFNTRHQEIDATIDKNVILGLQNVTRKLPENLLAEEPRRLADNARSVLASLRITDRSEIFLGQSQGSDGLQTYPQAVRRDENLSAAFRLIRGEIS